MSNIVVIGTTEFLPGFALAGVRETVLADPKDVLQKVQEHRSAGIIILDETLTYALTTAERETLEISTQPVIIMLTKDAAVQKARLKTSIMNTLGVDLLK